MFGEYYYAESPYAGDAITEAVIPEFEDCWADVICDETAGSWSPVEESANECV
jgi:hypothetical protein